MTSTCQAGQTDGTGNHTAGTSSSAYAVPNEKDASNVNLTLACQSITCMPAFEVSLILPCESSVLLHPLESHRCPHHFCTSLDLCRNSDRKAAKKIIRQPPQEDSLLARLAQERSFSTSQLQLQQTGGLFGTKNTTFGQKPATGGFGTRFNLAIATDTSNTPQPQVLAFFYQTQPQTTVAFANTSQQTQTGSFGIWCQV